MPIIVDGHHPRATLTHYRPAAPLVQAAYAEGLRQACGRRGRSNVERLMAEHGDAKLTDLLATLTDCPKARSVSVYDRCKAVYEGL